MFAGARRDGLSAAEWAKLHRAAGAAPKRIAKAERATPMAQAEHPMVQTLRAEEDREVGDPEAEDELEAELSSSLQAVQDPTFVAPDETDSRHHEDLSAQDCSGSFHQSPRRLGQRVRRINRRLTERERLRRPGTVSETFGGGCKGGGSHSEERTSGTWHIPGPRRTESPSIISGTEDCRIRPQDDGSANAG